MKKIALIACGSKKNKERTEAQHLYKGIFFEKSLELVLLKKYDKIFILSAKHGLLELNDVIEPYNESLLDKKINDRRVWADKIKVALNNKIKDDYEIDYYAGIFYREFLPKGNLVWRGRNQGNILKNLKEDISKEKQIHSRPQSY